MQKPKALLNEDERLNALRSYNLLDSDNDEIFDSFTKLASSICNTPVAVISLVDQDRQWFKSKIGIESTSTARDISFCGHAITQKELFVVKDALKDDRFSDNPLVTEAPNVVFYAGKPLIDDNGYAIGTLCVIDHKPRDLSAEQKKYLEIIGSQLIYLIQSRKKALELDKAFSLLAKLSESMPGFNYTYKISKDGHSSFPYASKHIYKIYELTPEEVAEGVDSLIGRIHADDLASVVESIQVSASNQSVWECEYRVILPKTGERWLRGNATPELTKEGDFLWHGYITDITELKNQQEALIKSAKMSSLGEMAAGIAHEINNPLTIIKTASQQLGHLISRGDESEGSEGASRLLKYVEKINQTTDRISKIVKGLKFVTSPTKNNELRYEPLKLIIEDTLALCHERFLNNGIALDIKFPENIATIIIECRSVEISQVLLNLLNNAFDAVELLDTRWVKVEISQIKNDIKILVIDSGKGIDRDLAQKIMTPFFTTKSAGKGTGLGLSIIQQLVLSHGGKLSIDLEHPNTCFVVTLPVSQKKI